MMSYAQTTSQTAAKAAPSRPEKIGMRNALALLVFVLGFAWPGTAPLNKEVVSLPTVKADELPNFHAIHNYFYRGAAPTKGGLLELKRLGVKTVIDLRRTPIMIESERAGLTELGIESVSIPMGNWIPSASKQNHFLQILELAATDPSKAPVFLHCSHGSDRTGYLTAVWRVQHDHWSLAEAIAEMLRYGFVVHKFESNPASRIDQ